MEAVLLAAHPRPFGRRRVPPSLPPVPAPENPAEVRAPSQVTILQEHLQEATQAARPIASTIAASLSAFARAGASLSGPAFAGLVAIGRSAARSFAAAFRSIKFRRRPPVPSK